MGAAVQLCTVEGLQVQCGGSLQCKGSLIVLGQALTQLLTSMGVRFPNILLSLIRLSSLLRYLSLSLCPGIRVQVFPGKYNKASVDYKE